MDVQPRINNPLNNPRYEKYFLFIWEAIKVVVVSLAIIIPVRYYLIQPFYVKGASMEPNFHNYEYLIIDELSYRLHEPARGDVIVLRNPQRQSQFFIKRIIGLPDEKIEIKNHRVLVNDQLLDESAYLEEEVKTWGNQVVMLQDNEFFVLGDNRNESLDSRVFGAVTRDEFVGRTWLRAWPLTRLSYFPLIEYNF